MSRPVVIMFFALMAGVAVADVLLYDAAWLALPSAKTASVLFVPWGVCVAATLLAFICYRSEEWASVFSKQSLFPALTVLFFFSLGFGRYAATAERQHRDWAIQGRPVNRGNPDEFDFVRWQWLHKGAPSGANGSGLSHKVVALRGRVVERLKSLGMDEQTTAVMSAMTLGDRSMLSRDTRDVFAATGASHLLALSGLHLGIIVGLFVLLMNGRLIRSRWRRVVGIVVLLFIWMYALLTAFPTSLVRASLMTSVFVIASLLNRYGNPLQHLLLTGIGLLLIRPMFLFDVGAQLSFLSVAGILLFYRPLYMWCFERWRYQIFWLERYWLMWPFTLVAVSLCAQVLTLPLVAYYFHQIPVYGALVSIVLIPLTTAFIYGAMFVVLLTFVWPALAAFLSVALTWIVTAMMWMLSLVAQWPGAVIEDFWSRKAASQIVVYNNRACPALHVIASPAESWLLMPEPEKADSGLYFIRRDFWKRRLTAPPQLLTGTAAMAVGDVKVVMAGKAPAGGLASKAVDLLWITRGFRGGHLDYLPECYSPRLVVLDASLPLWQRSALAKEAGQIGWRIYDVAEQGALVWPMPSVLSEP